MFSFEKIDNLDNRYQVFWYGELIYFTLARKDEFYLKSSKDFTIFTENRAVGEKLLLHFEDDYSALVESVEIGNWNELDNYNLFLKVSHSIGGGIDGEFELKMREEWNFSYSFKEYFVEFARLHGESGFSVTPYNLIGTDIEINFDVGNSLLYSVLNAEESICKYHEYAVKELTKNSLRPKDDARFDYDVFISHASEDKHNFVRPLAEKLTEVGFRVWYDEFQLKVGDKLRRSIDKGLANSRFGIVVLSPNFFQKNWTQYELDGLVQKEMTGEKAILPLWHKVSKDEVMKFSPSLADTVALNTAMFTIDELVEKLSEVLK